MSRNEMARSYDNYIFKFMGTAKLFSRVPMLTSIPINKIKAFQLFGIVTILHCKNNFYFSQSNNFIGDSSCFACVCVCVSLTSDEIKEIFMWYLPFLYSLGKHLFKSHCSLSLFNILVICFLTVEL